MKQPASRSHLIWTVHITPGDRGKGQLPVHAFPVTPAPSGPDDLLDGQRQQDHHVRTAGSHGVIPDRREEGNPIT
jgi:hypothetical protein